ncbi:hypothetical protein I6F11_04180 [Ensifer sp. NBAIM29]|nr:hypothetical protein [Ensifer sp. NBAIM29]
MSNWRDLPRASVTDLAHQAEEREIASYLERARHTAVDRNLAIEHLNKMARSKVWWLRQHGPKRPKNDVAVQETHLAVLVQVMDFLKGKGGLDAADPVG